MPGSRISRSREMPARSRLRSVRQRTQRCAAGPRRLRDRAARPARRRQPRASQPAGMPRSPRPDRSPGRKSRGCRSDTRRRATARNAASPRCKYRRRAAFRFRTARVEHRIEPADFLVGRNRPCRHVAGSGAEFDDIGSVGGQPARLCDGRRGIKKPATIGKQISGNIDDTNQQGADWRGGRHLRPAAAAFHDRADQLRLGEDVEFFNRDPDMADARITKHASQTRAAKPSHRSIWPDAAISRIAATTFS